MNLTLEQSDSIKIFVLEGDVDLHHSPRLRSEIQEVLKKKSRKLCFDLSKVSYLDSSGIATLIEAKQKLDKENGELRLCAIPKKVLSVFEIARLDKFFKIYPSRVEALKGF